MVRSSHIGSGIGAEVMDGKIKKRLDKPLSTRYNIRMKTSYTIYNPWNGSVIMARIPSERVAEMTRYFAWMMGVQASTMVVKIKQEKPLQLQAN